MNEPLVSIITPVYNDSKFVKQTIESVLNQTYSNFELIIVDDCSNDDSIAIIKSFNDERIKLFINDKNEGAAFSRNRALKNASGEYIAFLDGDDIWDKDKLKKQISFMIENKYLFSYTNYERIDEDTKPLGIFITGPKRVTHKDFIKSDYVGCLTVMYKKSICDNLQIPNDIYKRNDYALWIVLSQFADCYLLNETLSFYRVRGGGISKGGKQKLIKHHVIMFKKILNISTFKAYFYAIRNVFYYFVRSRKYKKYYNNQR